MKDIRCWSGADGHGAGSGKSGPTAPTTLKRTVGNFEIEDRSRRTPDARTAVGVLFSRHRERCSRGNFPPRARTSQPSYPLPADVRGVFIRG